jgi:exopolysaccharide production protein ExoQ
VPCRLYKGLFVSELLTATSHMPPHIASIVTVIFIAFLFIWESRKREPVSAALWLPVLWLAITGSRFVSQWVDLGLGRAGSGEGTLLDVLYFSTLIIAGLFVLARRRVVVSELIRSNPWITAFLIYGFIAIIWSDFTFISFKRWVKTFGHPVMALIILTDPNPSNALRTVLRRCAYLLMPTSVLFIKYYPEYGRAFSAWTGEGYNQGVATHKNMLGSLCIIFGMFFFWNLVTPQPGLDRKSRRRDVLVSVGFLGMIAWLLHASNSATSIVVTVIGVITIALLGLRALNKRFVGVYLMIAVIVVGLAEYLFDVRAGVIEFFGRDPTLTDRTEIWEDAIPLVPNPLLGAGFEGFWLGARLDILWESWPWQPLQAHNGYIETYLNLGYVGLFLLIGIIFSVFRKINRDLITNFELARLRLAFLIVIVVYNYTEAAFLALHPIWTIFYIIAIDYRPLKKLQPEMMWKKRGAGHSTAVT